MTATLHHRGFSLIEIVLTIMVLGILMAAGSKVVSDSLIATRNMNAGAASALDVRLALDRVARELRSMARVRDAGGFPSFLVEQAQSTSVSFRKVSGGALFRLSCTACTSSADAAQELRFGTVGGTEEVVLRRVSAFELTYLSSIRAVPLAFCADITACSSLARQLLLIEVTVTVERDVGGPLSLTTVMAMRSR